MESVFNDNTLDKYYNEIVNYVQIAVSPFLNNTSFSFFYTGITEGRILLEQCISNLNYIKNKVGTNNEIYIQLSEMVGVSVAGIIKIEVAQISMLANTQNYHDNVVEVNKSKARLTEATRLFGLIRSMEMSQRGKSKINENLQLLTEAHNRVYKTKSGCYIATCIYQDHDSPEVLKLRYFRDNTLSKNILGVLFIKGYYKFSPFIVKIIGKNYTLEKIFKKALDNIVDKIKLYN
jgi:hypothetical protein